MATAIQKSPVDSRLRRVFQWSAVVGGFIVGVAFVAGLVYKVITSARFRALLFEHFPATVGIPAALLASMCVVIIIESKSGPIEMEGFGLKFKGASGQIVLCTFLFLAIVGAIKLLW